MTTMTVIKEPRTARRAKPRGGTGPRQVLLGETERPHRRTISVLNAEDAALLGQLMAQDYEHMDSPVFHRAHAQRAVFEQAPAVGRADTGWYHPLMDAIGQVVPSNNPAVSLLTAAQEKALFLQFNYCRYQASLAHKQVRADADDVDAARELLHWHRRAMGLRERIAEFNLALVLAMAKRMHISERDFAEVVSEGNMALLRSIDKFNVERGFKFSTYACRAMLKAFSRTTQRLARRRQMSPVEFDPELERSNHDELRHQEQEDHCLEELRAIIRSNRAQLTGIEQSVLRHRFGLSGPAADSESDAGDPANEAASLTLAQVGQLVGLTKERVRQIQQTAMSKLRKSLEESSVA